MRVWEEWRVVVKWVVRGEKKDVVRRVVVVFGMVWMWGFCVLDLDLYFVVKVFNFRVFGLVDVFVVLVVIGVRKEEVRELVILWSVVGGRVLRF